MPALTYPDDLPACLLALSQAQQQQLNGSICNDENADDDEIQAYWVDVIGLTAEQAAEAVKYRARCLLPLFQLFPSL